MNHNVGSIKKIKIKEHFCYSETYAQNYKPESEKFYSIVNEYRYISL